MRRVAGIDSGTGYTKAIIVGQNGGAPEVLGRGRARSGTNRDQSAEAALAEALAVAELQRKDLAYIATTGCGRYGVSFRDIQITEITTAARGAAALVPDTACVLDVGSQSTRAIGVRDGGRVRNFKSNDKCAAGSGMFITRAAKYLEIDVEEIGPLSLHAQNPQPISSVCAVLAESEIINHVSAGVMVEDILRGIHNSLADRAATLLKRVGLERQVTFIGGVALQDGMVDALRERLGVRVDVPADCDYVCALGAALLGHARLEKLEQSTVASAG